MSARLSFILIPVMGWSIGFGDFTHRVYEHSEELVAAQGHIQRIGFEKASSLSGEPAALEASSRRIRGDDRTDSGTEYAMMLDWSFKTPAYKQSLRREWDAKKRSAHHQDNALRAMIGVAMKYEWLCYETAAERAAIHADKAAISSKAYEAGLKQHQAGRLSQMELLRLGTEAERAQSEYRQASMEAEHLQHRLRTRSMMDETVLIDDMPFRFVNDMQKVLGMVDAAPSVTAIQRQLDEIDTQILTLRNSRVESYSVGVGMTQEPTQKSVDVRLSLPFEWSDRRENKIAALMSEKSALLHQKTLTAEKLSRALAGMMKQLSEREALLERSHKAEQQYRSLFTMAHKALEGGVMNQFEYLAAKGAYYDARLRGVEIREAYLRELNTIETHLGRIIE